MIWQSFVVKQKGFNSSTKRSLSVGIQSTFLPNTLNYSLSPPVTKVSTNPNSLQTVVSHCQTFCAYLVIKIPKLENRAEAKNTRMTLWCFSNYTPMIHITLRWAIMHYTNIRTFYLGIATVQSKHFWPGHLFHVLILLRVHRVPVDLLSLIDILLKISPWTSCDGCNVVALLASAHSHGHGLA